MLQPQFLNLANSSFLLWLENYVLTKGNGFITGVSSRFYPVGQTYNGLYSYAAPYQPQVADSSIAQPMTGVYVGSTFYQRGQVPFIDVDYKRNLVHFSSQVSNVSGTYPLNDIQVLPLAVSENKLLFETKLNLRPRTTQTLTGISLDSFTYPSIYVKGFSNNNTPYALGGQDLTEINMGLFLFMDSSHSLDALKGILSDAKQELIPLLTADKFPFNIYGGFKETGSNFNYNTLKTQYLTNNSGIYIKDVIINSFKREYNLDFNKLNPDIHWAIAEFTICKPRLPRSTVNNL